MDKRMTKQQAAFRSYKDWAAFKDMLYWALKDRRRQIRNIIRGYSSEWKIENWDQWKIIRAHYYEEKQKLYEEFSCYPKTMISSTFQVDYDLVDEQMINTYVKKSILTDGIEEKRDPLGIHYRDSSGRQRRRYFAD